nr:uncharacterized protein LOC109150755 [Ipomoea batatas]
MERCNNDNKISFVRVSVWFVPMAEVNASTGANVNQTDSSSRTVIEVSFARPLPAPNMLHQVHHYVSIKLTSTNFLFWKAQLILFLRGQNLYGFVDGTHPCPTE